ncbi:hypothetical protein HPB50_015739 [Hyalomma asiaticum]|uniref:Uncharacterized protein n=1 Tax=Hyalomma asiaticum TaxID=266040 RepID=A0ACB7T121_HYAAI|nr:hypothetical protein HPB50_015739 [Hyalomma asiaticum]
MPAGSDGSDDLMSDFEVLSANDESLALGHVAGDGPLENLHLSLPHGDGTSLSKKLAQSTAKLQQQYNTFVAWKDKLTEAQLLLKHELSDTRRRLEEKCCLEVELRQLVEKLQVACTLSLSHAVVQLHDEQSKTALLTEKIEQLTEELESKTCQIRELEDVTSNLRRQAELETALLEKEALVRALQGQCESKVAEIEELRRALLTAEKNSDRARRDYAELLQTWQNYENSNDAGERTFVRVEQQSGAAALRDAAKMKRQSERQAQELAERESQIQALRQEVERLKKDLELLPPLQAQVDVYRTDYDTERNLRRQLETTVQQHLNTIEELREQITALQEPPPELRSSHSSSQR